MFGARPFIKEKVSDNQTVRKLKMKTTVSDHGLFQRAWGG
jgi:hypothetical protein